MANENSVVCVYATHPAAEAAVKVLQAAGFDMRKVSIVGRDYHTEEHPVGYYNSGDRMRGWGTLGGFWGGLWGFLFGAAAFWVPGIGPLVVAGPLVARIVGALEGAVLVGGVSVLGALRHRHSEGQHREVRDRAQVRQVRAPGPRDPGRSHEARDILLPTSPTEADVHPA